VTLLEEAENERMHLMVCMDRFDAGFGTRALVVSAQVVLAPLLFTVYCVHPKSMHRFVGYLEETACKTYLTVIDKIETPGTKLNTYWKDLAAPENAIGYWKLPADAKWVDALKCMVS
jgi:ubiquinol oxidase